MPYAYKCYQGSKRLNPKVNLPFLIIVAQKDHHDAFSEHHIFTGLEKPSFLHSSTGYAPDRSVTIEDFGAYVTLDAMLGSQLDRAQAHLENSIFELDKSLHHGIFWTGQSFEYHEAEEKCFISLAMDKRNKAAIAEMFDRTHSQALQNLEQIWRILSRIIIKPD